MHTFITAADSETLKGFHSPEEATGEPRRGCLSSLASQAEEGFGDRFRELPWTSCQLPITLQFRRPKLVQKEGRWGSGGVERKGSGSGCSLEGERTHCILCLQAVTFVFQAGILGEASVESASGFQLCPFRVMVATDWSATGQGVISQCSGFWHHPPGFATFWGLELK